MKIVRLILLLPLLAMACKTAPPPDTQTKPHEPDVKGEEVTYESGGVTLKGYLAWDAALEGPRPGVIVVHEWWGHNDYVRKRANMLANLGYTALAVDMYGDGKRAEHPEDAKKFAGEVFANMDVGRARFEAGMELLQKQPTTDPNRIAAVGYCFGGAIVVEMARRGLELKGVASFHPGSLATKSPAAPRAIKGPVIVFMGADDPFIPAEQQQTFKQEMADAEAELEWISYAGATHSFTVPEATAHGQKTGLPVAYNANADEDSWTKLGEFLGKIFL